MFWRKIKAQDVETGNIIDKNDTYGRVTSIKKTNRMGNVCFTFQVQQARPVVAYENEMIDTYGFHGTQSGKLA